MSRANVSLALALLASLLFLSSPVFAQSIIGAGASLTCTEWTRMRNEEREARQKGALQSLIKSTSSEVAWFMGFLSAVALLRPELPDLDAVDGTLIRDWMDQYCARNPKSNATDGLVELIGQLERKLPKPKRAAPPLECRAPSSEEKNPSGKAAPQEPVAASGGKTAPP